MSRTRVLAALLAGLTLAGLGTAATALGSDDPAASAPVTVVAQTRTTSPTSSPTQTPAVAVAVATGLTADEAVSRAVAHLGGGTATKVERETEHGARCGRSTSAATAASPRCTSTPRPAA